MVEYKYAYMCPYCHRTYDKEDDARDCGNECRDTEPVKEVSMFFCEICGSHYPEESKAENCELRHENANDLLYQQYLVKKNFDALKKAASAPGQVKLMDIKTKKAIAKNYGKMMVEE